MKVSELQESKKRFKVEFKSRSTDRELETTLDRMRKLPTYTHADLLRVDRLPVDGVLKIQQMHQHEKLTITVTRLA